MLNKLPFYVISRQHIPSVLIEGWFFNKPSGGRLFEYKSRERLYKDHQFFEAFRNYKQEIEGVENEDKKRKNLENEEVIQSNKSEIEYKIQLGTFLESMKNSSIFNGIEVEEFQSNGTYKYLVHATSDKKLADQLKVKYRSGKFPGIYNKHFTKENK